MIIAVSGTPGVGKTSFSKRLAFTLDAEYVNISEYITQHNIPHEQDSQRDCLVIDIQTIQDSLQSYCDSQKSYVLDSHLTTDFSPHFVDIIFVCTCDISVLRNRLEERSYSAEKVRENLDAEIFQVSLTDAQENGFTPILVDCTTEISDEKIKEYAKKIQKKE
ncbi:MAG: AAA family ATPase [Candidatus Woesearchaeota archaeon]